MGQELVEMSSKELDRLAVVRQVLEGRLTQAKAGEFVGVSERQVRRLCAAFEDRGPAGLVSGKRGQPSNRRLPDELRSQAIEIVRDRYADFGPTLACEKLLEGAQRASRASPEGSGRGCTAPPFRLTSGNRTFLLCWEPAISTW